MIIRTDHDKLEDCQEQLANLKVHVEAHKRISEFNLILLVILTLVQIVAGVTNIAYTYLGN